MRWVRLATPLPTLERGCFTCCRRGVWFSCAAPPLAGTVALRPGSGGGGGGKLQGAGAKGAATAAGAVAEGAGLVGACRHGMRELHVLIRTNEPKMATGRGSTCC